MIQLTHPKILQFYENHPSLDPNQHHLAFLEFYESILSNENSAIISQTKAEEILGQIDQVQQSVLSKFYEIKSKNQEDMKSLLDNYSTSNYLKIVEKMEQLVKQRMDSDPVKSDSFITQLITNTEDRLRNHIGDIKQQQTDQERVHQEILQFLNLYKTPSKKGEISENMIHVTLSQHFPSAEIVHTAKQTSAGDCILKRGSNKPVILFENKNYQTNVPKHEVDKFIFDIEQNNCSGVFMSQKSGITLKQNFEINVHKDNILVYIHSMNYDQEKLLIAIDIIDQISDRLKTFTNSSYLIPVDIMENIRSQYLVFTEKRERILTQLNDNTKKMVQDIRDLCLPDLTTFLSKGGGSTGDSNGSTELLCPNCNKFTAMNKRSLSSHLSTCTKKHGKSDTSVETEIK